MRTKHSIRRSWWRAVLTAAASALAFAAPAAAEETIIYFHQDALGSVRLVTGNDGEVLARHDYLPFGEEVPAGQFGRAVEAGYGAAEVAPQHFTGKERDTESGLDYFGARYFSSQQGRFTSPDRPLLDQKPLIPQSWNLYAYVRSNPLRFVDPNGRCTHTDANGKVVAVYQSGCDLGVYKHDDLSKWNGKDVLASGGKGVSRMGETEYADEFKAGNRIIYGTSFDADIFALSSVASLENPASLALHSSPGGAYDIKRNARIAPFGGGTGRLLNGKYVTAESAGNYLAGLDAGLNGRSWDMTIRAAGALHILSNGLAVPKAPWYGENEYTGRRVGEGFNAAESALALEDQAKNLNPDLFGMLGGVAW